MRITMKNKRLQNKVSHVHEKLIHNIQNNFHGRQMVCKGMNIRKLEKYMTKLFITSAKQWTDNYGDQNIGENVMTRSKICK
jgi:hypothetical protein